MVCLRAPHERAAAAFYAVENFRSKLKMVDAVFQLAITDEDTKAEWVDIQEKIASKSKLRNELAHYEVLEDKTLRPGKRMALRPAILSPHSPSAFKVAGLHIVELRVRQLVFRKLSERTRRFLARR